MPLALVLTYHSLLGVPPDTEYLWAEMGIQRTLKPWSKRWGLPELWFDFEIIHLLLACFQAKGAALSLCSSLDWPCPRSSGAESDMVPLSNTHPEGFVHGGISSHSQRNQRKTTPRQKQNAMKEAQNCCEHNTKQQQFCTSLDFASVLHKINSEDDNNKILQQGLGAGEKGASFTYLFCIVVAG